MLQKILSLDFSFPLARKVVSAFYRDGKFYRVPFGPLRGMQLHYDSGMTAHTILGVQDLSFFSITERLFEAWGWRDNASYSAIDLGANRGIYTLFFSKMFGEVHSFEPNPPVFKILLQNCKKNRLTNIRAFQKAVSDHKGTLELCIGEEDHTGFLKGVQESKHPLQTFQVETISLDDWMKENDPLPIRFLKMDIEGAGALAIAGGQKLIQKFRPVIYFESHSQEEDRSLGKVLRELDYEAYRLTNSKWVKDHTETHPAIDGVWGNCLVFPKDLVAKTKEILK